MEATLHLLELFSTSLHLRYGEHGSINLNSWNIPGYTYNTVRNFLDNQRARKRLTKVRNYLTEPVLELLDYKSASPAGIFNRCVARVRERVHCILGMIMVHQSQQRADSENLRDKHQHGGGQRKENQQVHEEVAWRPTRTDRCCSVLQTE
jgi:hypothetical protein